MPEIDVAKAFTLTHENGQKTRFVPGVHSVEDHVAGHWYVKAHLSGAKPKHAPGSPAFMRAETEAKAEAARKLAEEEAAIEAELLAEERATAGAKLKALSERALREQATSTTNVVANAAPSIKSAGK